MGIGLKALFGDDVEIGFILAEMFLIAIERMNGEFNKTAHPEVKRYALIYVPPRTGKGELTIEEQQLKHYREQIANILYQLLLNKGGDELIKWLMKSKILIYRVKDQAWSPTC